MSLKVKDLIKKLQEKDQDTEVEFAVVTTNGDLVCMDIETTAKSMADLLKLFNT